MKIIKIFLLLTLFNAAMAGCSKKEEAKALPLTLSVSNISHSNEVSFILDEEEALTVDITSGNGGYTIIPKTMTFFQGNKLGEPVRTDVNPEEFVKAELDGNSVVFTRIKMPDHPCVSYVVSDSMGETICVYIHSPDWLGGL